VSEIFIKGLDWEIRFFNYFSFGNLIWCCASSSWGEGVYCAFKIFKIGKKTFNLCNVLLSL